MDMMPVGSDIGGTSPALDGDAVSAEPLVHRQASPK
jgi:hypothetical protein